MHLELKYIKIASNAIICLMAKFRLDFFLFCHFVVDSLSSTRKWNFWRERMYLPFSKPSKLKKYFSFSSYLSHCDLQREKFAFCCFYCILNSKNSNFACSEPQNWIEFHGFALIQNRLRIKKSERKANDWRKKSIDRHD